MKYFKTHCGRMDHGGCGLIVAVEGNIITEIRGDPQGLLNKGYICPKGALSAERLTHPDRLRHPLKRIGGRGEGRWKRISWDTALKEVSDRLLETKRDFGPRGVAFCLGMPKGLEHFVLIRLANVFGSPNIVACQDVCHAPREITGIHTCGFYPVADLRHKSELVLLWGSNVGATNEEGQTKSLLDSQLRSGSKLLVIDTRRTPLVERADLWLQPRPGSDALLALAFINVIIEESLYDRDFVTRWTYGFDDLADHVKGYTPEYVSKLTWVPAEQIRHAANLYARSRPAALQWGNAIEHRTNAFDTARGLVSLMAITGNLDVPGGNIKANEPPVLSPGKFTLSRLIPEKRKEMIGAYHGVIPRLMTTPPAYFKKAVLEGIPYPVRSAYVMCSNPLLAYADTPQTFEALMDLDFLCVTDIFMTPSAAIADIVLPAATHFEFDDIGHYGLGHGLVLARPGIVAPPEECWPDMKILNELGKLISEPSHWYEDYHEFLEDLLNPAGITYEEFKEEGYLEGPHLFRKYEERGFKTPTGRVELKLSTAESLNLNPLPSVSDFTKEEGEDFPLILTTAKSPNYLHSSYRWIDKLRNLEPVATVEMHPETALKYSIKEGDSVTIETRRGAIVQNAIVSRRVHPGVIHASSGWWFRGDENRPEGVWSKSNVNMLTASSKTGKEFGTPDLRALPCRIGKSE